jgi:ABC-type Zn2+ transport system substrate-binding protein/surface adhesin
MKNKTTKNLLRIKTIMNKKTIFILGLSAALLMSCGNNEGESADHGHEHGEHEHEHNGEHDHEEEHNHDHNVDHEHDHEQEEFTVEADTLN